MPCWLLTFDRPLCETLSVCECIHALETAITFHVNAMSQDIAKKVRAELRCGLSDTLMVLPVVHDVIPHLSQQVFDDIAKLESSSVHIEVGK